MKWWSVYTVPSLTFKGNYLYSIYASFHDLGSNLYVTADFAVVKCMKLFLRQYKTKSLYFYYNLIKKSNEFN